MDKKKQRIDLASLVLDTLGMTAVIVKAITHKDENEDFKILYLLIASLACLSPVK